MSVEIPTGFTPGPWCFTQGSLMRVAKSHPGGGIVLAGVHKFGALGGRKCAGSPEANARLIALAPEMAAEIAALRAELAATREALSHLDILLNEQGFTSRHRIRRIALDALGDRP